jgi:hypothetical protein
MRRSLVSAIVALAPLGVAAVLLIGSEAPGQTTGLPVVRPLPAVAVAPACPTVGSPVVVIPAPCYLPSPYNPLVGPPYAVGPVPTPVPAARVVTIRGRHYQIIPTNDKGDYPEDVVERIPVTVAKGPAGASADQFTGTARRLAKTTIFDGDAQDFDAVAALLDSLPANQTMKDKGISSGPDSDRVDEEKKNVRVRAFIYAFKKEADHDYHVLVGDAPDTADLGYLNVEVSGIPIAGTEDNRTKLLGVRNEFKTKFQLGDTGPSAYHLCQPPVPVRITGSLFWDVDHQTPPYVGPQNLKPKTAWEIHPISVLEFGSP